MEEECTTKCRKLVATPTCASRWMHCQEPVYVRTKLIRVRTDAQPCRSCTRPPHLKRDRGFVHGVVASPFLCIRLHLGTVKIKDACPYLEGHLLPGVILVVKNGAYLGGDRLHRLLCVPGCRGNISWLRRSKTYALHRCVLLCTSMGMDECAESLGLDFTSTAEIVGARNMRSNVTRPPRPRKVFFTQRGVSLHHQPTQTPSGSSSAIHVTPSARFRGDREGAFPKTEK